MATKQENVNDEAKLKAEEEQFRVELEPEIVFLG